MQATARPEHPLVPRGGRLRSPWICRVEGGCARPTMPLSCRPDAPWGGHRHCACAAGRRLPDQPDVGVLSALGGHPARRTASQVFICSISSNWTSRMLLHTGPEDLGAGPASKQVSASRTAVQWCRIIERMIRISYSSPDSDAGLVDRGCRCPTAGSPHTDWSASSRATARAWPADCGRATRARCADIPINRR
jgi:hypothetical protein